MSRSHGCARRRARRAEPRRSGTAARARAWRGRRRAAASSRARLAGVMLAAAPPNARARTQADLDEHQRVAVAHDEVDLAAARAEIAGDERRGPAGQELGGERLGAGARSPRARAGPSARAIERRQLPGAEHGEPPFARELVAVDERHLPGRPFEHEVSRGRRRGTPARRETRRGRARTAASAPRSRTRASEDSANCARAGRDDPRDLDEHEAVEVARRPPASRARTPARWRTPATCRGRA